MGIFIFVVIFLFVLGGLLLLLRSANSHKLPPNIKAQPYKNDDE
jgi:hypothetical protein